jgi:hypothetical protein
MDAPDDLDNFIAEQLTDPNFAAAYNRVRSAQMSDDSDTSDCVAAPPLLVTAESDTGAPSARNNNDG